MIAIKPHHFVDIITALGDGRRTYEPHAYGHAVHTVAALILGDPDVELQMELGADDICAPCRHNLGGHCDDVIDTSYRPLAPRSKGEWNRRIDERWCARLGLEPGARLTARRFCELLLDLPPDTGEVVYCEVPREMTAARLRQLQAGVRCFLGEASPPPRRAAATGGRR
ncbi:MAG: hypothetical protein ABIL09_10785 [Gemmatimonadota bacterium]